MGFSIPLAQWLRGPLKDKLQKKLLGKGINDSGIFNMIQLEKMFDEHQSSRYDHSTALWSLLMLANFLDKQIN